MSRELFEKVLSILPLTRSAGKGGTGVYLSCLYEPLVSPHFFEFLEMLPREARKKVFLTTNLCRPCSREELEQLLRANVHHINISIETMDRARHQIISGSKLYDSFQKNLETLAALYPAIRGYRPKLRFITMILRINRDEIPSLVNLCSGKFHASLHELRTPYISVYENMAWNREQLMEPQECEQLKQELAALHLPLVHDIHSRSELVVAEPESECVNADVPAEDVPAERSVWDEKLAEIAFCMHPEFFFLRFHASGSCTLNVTKETFSICDLEDPVTCFKEKLEALQLRRIHAFYLENSPAEHQAQPVPMRVALEEIKANPLCLTLRGWYRAPGYAADRYIPLVTIRSASGGCTASRSQDVSCAHTASRGCTASHGHTVSSAHTVSRGCTASRSRTAAGDCETAQSFLLYTAPRPDLGSRPDTAASGFTVCIGRQYVPRKLFVLEFSFLDTDSGEIAFCYTYPHRILWK